ncbi:precorrin-3B synthase [Rhizobium sp. S152]|uniref:precorrin-3B synthase n=1 Tax=Rhizobium sp. S152 TaxID=3055038 RepID=UPI0025A9E375|nr:precorrin-3B synthase [Rhizobium sp. S152]MDM9624859.1 precorrin-3B synthase [Rhizobium sp. S152]
MTLKEQRARDMGVASVSPAMRRGACPTLSAPMPTGDGLLARLRPASGNLTIGQFRLLALAAFRSGNGIIEITARGSLQIRGVRAETIATLSSDVTAAGISVPAGPAIELPTLHGIDPDELADAADMEQRIRERLAPTLLHPALAPKLAITVDGGGAFGLSAVKADIRVTALAQDRWQVAVNGDARTAVPVSVGSMDDAVEAVGRVLCLLLSLGRQKRGRDLTRELLCEAFPLMNEIGIAAPTASKPAIGQHILSDGRVVLGLRPRFGQLRATDLISFLTAAEALGATDVRPAPERALFIIGLNEQAAEAVAKIAEGYGLSADPDDISARIATCAGAGACASSHYYTKSLAAAITRPAAVLLDGSMTLHLSGCAKGCAHQQRALTIVGTKSGYGLVLDGLASDRPDAYIAGGDIDSAIQRLARLIENEAHAGESAAACLRRLDKAGVAKALQQE